jgi:cell volume regulation protein A
MQWHNEVLLGGALLLALAIALGGLSSRLGLPFLPVFLLVGMLGGEDGPGGIDFDDVPLSFLVANLALAVILLDGGLRTRLATFRVGLRPALALACVGVAVTALATGLFASWMLAIDWRLGLLLGAIVASTDAAAVFSLLKASGLRLSDRIGATLEIESGVNDPMAIFLTLVMIGVVQSGAWPGPGTLAVEFGRQFGVGAAAGVAAGWAMAATARWWPAGDGLAAILLAAAGVAVFALANLLGGSGFLAVYLFGLVVTHRAPAGHGEMLRAMDGLAWLAQSSLFLLLGLLVTPAELPALAGAALAIAAFLILVARPLSVAACLAPFRFSAPETAYVAWVGLRGAVPIVLAMFPLLAGVPQARLLFNVAFVVVLASLLVQGTTVALAARRLGIDLPRRDGPLVEHPLAGGRVLAEFRIGARSPACGLPARSLALHGGARVVDASRDATPLPPDAPLAAGDHVVLVGLPEDLVQCEARFAEADDVPRHRAPLAWQLPAEADWAQVCEAYALRPADPPTPGQRLGDALEAAAGRALAEGDRIPVDGSVFVVAGVDAAGGRADRFAFEPRDRGRPPRGRTGPARGCVTDADVGTDTDIDTAAGPAGPGRRA